MKAYSAHTNQLLTDHRSAPLVLLENFGPDIHVDDLSHIPPTSHLKSTDTEVINAIHFTSLSLSECHLSKNINISNVNNEESLQLDFI